MARPFSPNYTYYEEPIKPKVEVKPKVITESKTNTRNNPTRLPYQEYHNYIKSEKWQETKRRFFASKMYKALKMNENWECFCCRDSYAPLELHHKTYKRLGNEHLNDLVPVCRECHQKIHDLVRKNNGLGVWGYTNVVKRAYTKNFKRWGIYKLEETNVGSEPGKKQRRSR